MTQLTMAKSINEGLRRAMADDPKVLVMGEDIGKLGGVFRVTDGLLDQFGAQRVIDTPLAESGIMGTAVGLAFRGFRPVVEIQFDGFVYPAFDQIVCQVAKLHYRTRGNVTMPITIRIPWAGGDARVIGIVPGQILTDSLVDAPAHRAGEALPDAERDLAKIAVVERHLGTGRVGLGFVRGFGLRRGALASSVAHDAHNVVVVGMNDASMAAAVRRLANRGGGIVVVDGAEVLAELPLPVAGLLSDAPLAEVLEASHAVIAAARELGCELEAPFQHLAFLALSVIPSLKLTDRGLVDVDRFELVALEAG